MESLSTLRDHGAPRGKLASLVIVLLAQVAAMGVWFSSTTAVALIKRTQAIASGDEAMLTGAVQLGFVAGTVVSATLALPDRYDLRKIFAASALVAALTTGALAVLPPTGPVAIGLRLLTGICMAGVYPVGIRLVATWANADLGLLIGLLVAALTLGSASPHLVGGLPDLDWRWVYLAAATLAVLSGVAIGFARIGPNIKRASRVDFSKVTQAWRNPAVRLANLGYLGHMWELYAMWAWLGLFLQYTLGAHGVANFHETAEVLTFAVIAFGALGAWAGGLLADRIGRTRVTIGAMALSATCAAVIGWLPGAPLVVVVGVAFVWGFSVIADSAQFSAAVAELADPTSVGTLLTAQTCVGFLLTLVSIRLVPVIVAHLGWGAGMSVLAIGPALGCVAMWRLRQRPESQRMAGGKR
ncbi:MFS transporter [Pandoraea faecigallinarum]|uniref:MFS transporter n=1 Tax=Pandoraea faecigallinarum TaxID=656179 RepID=A0A0H3WYG4_9BURK|nr:MFS transporter [Pandoraea faecigallinarum]AKM31591.1 MFS transporter [Pandoraea faecigallinarum]